MVLQDQPTQNEQPKNQYRQYFGLIGKNVLKFVSSLILPLMLGIFTVVITFQQQKIARQQRLEDKNESRLQREQDWNISQIAQESQSKAISERYRDEVLVAYTKEIGDLFKEYKFSLTSDLLIHTLARVKTLNAIGQLDGPRQIRIIRFLYEAVQLTSTNKFGALDISTAELTDINFRTFTPSKIIDQLSLAGVYLRNCTFETIHLFNVNFSSAWLDNVNFSSAELKNVNFSSAKLENVNFSSADVFNVKFSSARLEDVNFSSTHLNDVNFSPAWLETVNFSSARVNNVNFSSARLYNISFSFAERVRNVNFSSASLSNVNFSSTWLFNVNFSSTLFDNFFGVSHFDHANMAHTIFVKCACYMIDFTDANLKGSSFHGALLSDVNFSRANLQNADFTDTTITECQLQSALSIRNAKLPNGTLGRGRNLVKNGDANCNISLVDHWKVQNGNITVMPSKEDRGECQFTLQSISTGAMMSQRIDLVGIWDSSFWVNSNIELQANMSSGVSMELSGKNSNGAVLKKDMTNSSENKIIMLLQKDMHELEVVVKFKADTNKYDNSNIWCDNIELFIDYDMW